MTEASGEEPSSRDQNCSTIYPNKVHSSETDLVYILLLQILLALTYSDVYFAIPHLRYSVKATNDNSSYVIVKPYRETCRHVWINIQCLKITFEILDQIY